MSFHCFTPISVSTLPQNTVQPPYQSQENPSRQALRFPCLHFRCCICESTEALLYVAQIVLLSVSPLRQKFKEAIPVSHLVLHHNQGLIVHKNKV